MYVVNISQQNGGFPLVVLVYILRFIRKSATWNVHVALSICKYP